jgi:1,4-alpha-glucan branching enzyme
MAAERMIQLANSHPAAEGLLKRALNQAARELLLAQSSDWAFLITVGTARQYSEKRTREHIGRFLDLYHRIRENRLEEGAVAAMEDRDNIFPHVDYRVYQSSSVPEPALAV